eukprot:COSAG01_NODE_601_length_14954_cov_175.954359_6_plen_171_part_00
MFFHRVRSPVLAEICLCHARSCEAIEGGNAPAGVKGGGPGKLTRAVASIFQSLLGFELEQPKRSKTGLSHSKQLVFRPSARNLAKMTAGRTAVLHALALAAGVRVGQTYVEAPSLDSAISASTDGTELASSSPMAIRPPPAMKVMVPPPPCRHQYGDRNHHDLTEIYLAF